MELLLFQATGRRRTVEEISRIGIDLGKHVYQVCGMDSSGAVVLQRRVKAPRLVELMAQLKPCLVGLEACGSAHYWWRSSRRWATTCG